LPASAGRPLPARCHPMPTSSHFVLQMPTYHQTEADLLNLVAAALSGWVAGPSLIIPLVAVVGCSAIVFWSLISTFICQIWAAKMTGVDAGVDDYIPSTISRLFCGFFGGMPAILGSGYIIDMFFLHRRGKSFAVSERLSSSPSSVAARWAASSPRPGRGIMSSGGPWAPSARPSSPSSSLSRIPATFATIRPPGWASSARRCSATGSTTRSRSGWPTAAGAHGTPSTGSRVLSYIQ